MAVWQLYQWSDFITAVYGQCDMASGQLGHLFERIALYIILYIHITYMFLCWFQILVAVNIRLYNWIDRKRIIAHKIRQILISTRP